MVTYPIKGISSSAHAAATPFVKKSVDHKLASFSTPTIFVTAAARLIVSAVTSLNAMPPTSPFFTYSSSRNLNVVSIGTSGSTLAHSNTSIFFKPTSSNCFKTLSSSTFTAAGSPTPRRDAMSKQPLTESTILVASEG